MKTNDKKEEAISINSIDAPEEDYLYVKASQIPNAGKGLYTVINIYKNEIISLFKGEIISDQEAERRVQQNEDGYFINLLDDTVMDSMHTHCYAKYANDAKGSTNNDFKNNAKITLDDDDNVCLQATSKIKSGEEVFCSYGKDYWDKHG